MLSQVKSLKCSASQSPTIHPEFVHRPFGENRPRRGGASGIGNDIAPGLADTQLTKVTPDHPKLWKAVCGQYLWVVSASQLYLRPNVARRRRSDTFLTENQSESLTLWVTDGAKRPI